MLLPFLSPSLPPCLPACLPPYLATVKLPVIDEERQAGEGQEGHGQDGVKDRADDMGHGQEGGAACFPAADLVVD